MQKWQEVFGAEDAGVETSLSGQMLSHDIKDTIFKHHVETLCLWHDAGENTCMRTIVTNDMHYLEIISQQLR